MLSIKNLCKSYRYADARQSVLNELEFDMAASTSVALLGESGSGKSTLLHLIAGLDRPDSGEILFAGQALHSAPESTLAALRRSRLSLVFQQFHLMSTLTVLDNIRFQAALCRRLDAAYEAELIERLALGDQTHKVSASTVTRTAAAGRDRAIPVAQAAAGARRRTDRQPR